MIDQVQAGEEIIITRRGKRVARVVRERDFSAQDQAAVLSELRTFLARQTPVEKTAVARVRELRDHAREAAPDFVGLSDVADLIGVTLQNMRKLMLAHADTFPVPVHSGSTLIWHLDDVLDWLSARGRYPVAETTLETARLLRQLNLARETRHLKPDVVQFLEPLSRLSPFPPVSTACLLGEFPRRMHDVQHDDLFWQQLDEHDVRQAVHDEFVRPGDLVAGPDSFGERGKAVNTPLIMLRMDKGLQSLAAKALRG